MPGYKRPMGFQMRFPGLAQAEQRAMEEGAVMRPSYSITRKTKISKKRRSTLKRKVKIKPKRPLFRIAEGEALREAGQGA